MVGDRAVLIWSTHVAILLYRYNYLIEMVFRRSCIGTEGSFLTSVFLAFIATEAAAICVPNRCLGLYADSIKL